MVGDERDRHSGRRGVRPFGSDGHVSGPNRAVYPGVNRRTVLKGVGGAALLTAFGGIGAAADQEADVRWTFGADGFVESSPTIVDDVVYVGDEGGNVYAVDANAGRKRWVFSTGAQIRSDAQVVGGTVYIGSTDENVYAIDAESGEERWHFETGAYVNSSPTRVGDTVYVGSEDTNVYALDAETGEERWRYTTGDIVTNAPTVVDGLVYVGSRDETVYALNADTGDLAWRFNTGLWISSEVTVVDGVAYVGSDDSTVYALDAVDGSLVWEFTEPTAHVISATTYHDGVVYVGTDAETYGVADDPTEAVLYAIDADTGEKRWEFVVEVPDDTDDDWQFHASPTVADGVVYVGNVNGTVYGIDADDGDLVWSFETEDAVWSSPTVVDGTLYVGSDDGNLYAIDLDTDGSSADSRIELGTLGHHDVWHDNAPDAEGTPPASLRLSTSQLGDVTQGTMIDVTVVVDNEGPGTAFDVAVTFDLFDELQIDETIDELPPGEQAGFDVESDTTEIEPGTYEWVSEANGETQSGSFTIEPEDERDADDELPPDESDDRDEEATPQDRTGEGDDSEPSIEIDTEEVPGFGLPSGIAAVLGSGYLLRRVATESPVDPESEPEKH